MHCHKVINIYNILIHINHNDQNQTCLFIQITLNTYYMYQEVKKTYHDKINMNRNMIINPSNRKLIDSNLLWWFVCQIVSVTTP